MNFRSQAFGAASCPSGQDIDFITQGCAPSVMPGATSKPPGVYETHLPIGGPGGSCAWRCNWVWAGTDAANKAIASQAAACVGRNDKSGGWVLSTISNNYTGKSAGWGEGASGEEACGAKTAPPPAPPTGMPTPEWLLFPQSLYCKASPCSDPRNWKPAVWGVAAGAVVLIGALCWILKSAHPREDYPWEGYP